METSDLRGAQTSVRLKQKECQKEKKKEKKGDLLKKQTYPTPPNTTLVDVSPLQGGVLDVRRREDEMNGMDGGAKDSMGGMDRQMLRTDVVEGKTKTNNN